MKSKNFLKRFATGFLSACLLSCSFLLTGCLGDVDDEDPLWIQKEKDRYQNGEISEEEFDDIFEEKSNGIDLEGIKVLRRPPTYDYDNSVAKGEDIYSDYYLKLSQDIFSNLYRVYGVIDYAYQLDLRAPGANIFEALYKISGDDNINKLNSMWTSQDDGIKYFYDAIRNTITTISDKKVKEIKDDEGKVITKIDYWEVTADNATSWNWVKGYTQISYNHDKLNTFTYSNSNSLDSSFGKLDNSKITNNKTNTSLTNMQGYFSNQELFNSSAYQEALVGTSEAQSDFVYTLAYAIYSLVLGIRPAEAAWVSGTWQVAGFNAEGTVGAEGYKSSAMVAFDKIKEVFTKAGSYVGLTERNKSDIKQYILDNVIGADALNAQNAAKQDLYYNAVVDAVVEYCGKLTTIGQAGTEDSSTGVGDSFIASEIVDYPGSSFFLDVEEELGQSNAYPSYEYQSMVLMPFKEINITDIALDFAYTAKNEAGTVLDNKDLSLTIGVTLRWWTGTEMLTLRKTITVYNQQEYDPGGSSTLEFFDLDSKDNFGKAITIGKFDCEPINTFNNHDEQQEGKFYKLTIKGNTLARHYYEVINSTTYGGYGVLNTQRLSTEHPNMSYLEIAFDVAKPINDYSRNYDFYTGFSVLYNSEKSNEQKFAEKYPGLV